MSYELLDVAPGWHAPHAASDHVTSYSAADPKKLSNNPAARACEYPSASVTPVYTSKWTIEWRVPALIASFYVLGIHETPSTI